jgi:hypothetical protein
VLSEYFATFLTKTVFKTILAPCSSLASRKLSSLSEFISSTSLAPTKPHPIIDTFKILISPYLLKAKVLITYLVSPG